MSTKRPFLRADATALRASDIKTIVTTRGKIPNAAAFLAKKFHVSTRRIYQIWNQGGEKKKPVAASKLYKAAMKPRKHKSSTTKSKTGGGGSSKRTHAVEASSDEPSSEEETATPSAQSTEDLLARGERLFAR